MTIRTLLAAVALSAAPLAGLGLTPTPASAAPPAVGPAHRPGPPWLAGRGHHAPRGYEVAVRRGEQWTVVAAGRDRDEAWRLAQEFRQRGEHAVVRWAE